MRRAPAVVGFLVCVCASAVVFAVLVSSRLPHYRLGSGFGGGGVKVGWRSEYRVNNRTGMEEERYTDQANPKASFNWRGTGRFRGPGWLRLGPP